MKQLLGIFATRRLGLPPAELSLAAHIKLMGILAKKTSSETVREEARRIEGQLKLIPR